MIAYATKTFKELPENAHVAPAGETGTGGTTTGGADGADSAVWLADFQSLIATLEQTSHRVTSLLAIVSAAISSGKPLPPYLRTPERYRIGETLRTLDQDVLRTRHVCEPGYSAFAVMQVSTAMLAEDMADLLADAKQLVGEADFDLDLDLDVVRQDYEKSVGMRGGPAPVLPPVKTGTKED